MQVFHDKEQGDGASVGLGHDSLAMAPVLLPGILLLLWYVYHCLLFSTSAPLQAVQINVLATLGKFDSHIQSVIHAL